MKVTITTDGMYSDFDGQFAGATKRKKGEVVEYPDWYAGMLIGNCLAVMAVEVKPPIEPDVVVPEPVVPASKRPYVRKGRKPSAK